jgi:predicted DNA-binding transcriptional regulator AlpA
MNRTILRLPQISEKTGIPEATIRWYRHRGVGFETFLLARRICAYEDEIDKWIAKQAAQSRRGA